MKYLIPTLVLLLTSLLVPGATAEPTAECGGSIDGACYYEDDNGNSQWCTVWLVVNSPDWPLEDCAVGLL